MWAIVRSKRIQETDNGKRILTSEIDCKLNVCGKKEQVKKMVQNVGGMVN